MNGGEGIACLPRFIRPQEICHTLAPRHNTKCGEPIMTPDSELIARSIARDERAFSTIFDRYAPAVFRFALSITKSSDDAQELTQQTFITAWRRLADIRLVGDSMVPWLIVSCRNHSHNLRRTQAVHQTVDLPEVGHSPVASVVEVREELDAVLAAIADLGETDRLLVELCVFEGYTYREAAKLIGGSAGGLAKRMERTRRSLSPLRNNYREEGAQP